jgi:BioD-like phosphotransacetylase family protein
MANLYVTSAETFAGKSAVCIGLGVPFRADGIKAGYMKPVNVNCRLREGVPCDDDVVERNHDTPESTLIGRVALTRAGSDNAVQSGL